MLALKIHEFASIYGKNGSLQDDGSSKTLAPQLPLLLKVENDVRKKMWTHIIGELITPLMLITGGVEILIPTARARVAAAFALGALVCTSLDSLE